MTVVRIVAAVAEGVVVVNARVKLRGRCLRGLSPGLVAAEVVGGMIGLSGIVGGRLSRIERLDLRREEEFAEFAAGADMTVLL